MMLLSVGIAWIAGVVMERSGGHRWATPAWVIVILLVVSSAVESWRYIPAWRNDAALFGAVRERQPDNPVGHLGLAGVRLGEGRIDAALRLIETAEQLKPDVPEIHQYRAEIAFSRGEWDAPVQHAERTLALDPGVRIHIPRPEGL
jgi:tetratricopeptide (TPR) repeat protein